MAKKRESGLGRGLDALMGGEDAALLEGAAGGVTTLPLEEVEPNAAQPRRNFDEAALADLADSIAVHGILQPITVRRLQSGYYQIVSGERRWRAARLAGLREVPVLIVDADDRTVTEVSLIENLQREDLNPMEEAEGYRRLMAEFDLTQEEVAQRVGKSRPAVANTVRLLELSEQIQEMVRDGRITPGHARAVLAVQDPQRRTELAQKAAGGMSVRQTENLAKQMNAPKEEPVRAKQPEVDYAAEAAEELSRILGRRVRIVTGAHKGRLELEFYGEEDLNALLEGLAGLN